MKSYSVEQLKSQYEKDGYFVIKDLLDSETIEYYIEQLCMISGIKRNFFDQKFALQGGFTLANRPSVDEVFWPLIIHEKLIGTLREVIGDIKYTQHGDVHVNNGNFGWHRDSKDRAFGVGSDWDESKDEYNIVRIALYLQDYASSKGSLKVIPGSHKNESQLSRWEHKLHGCFNHYIINKLFKLEHSLAIPLFFSKPVTIKTSPGDIIIFNQRLYHTGSRIKGPKYAIFWSYGLRNTHSINHMEWYNERTDYKTMPEKLVGLLKEKKLFLS